MDLPDYAALQKAIRERTTRYCLMAFALSMSGFVLLIFVSLFTKNEISSWLTGVSIGIILMGFALGGSFGLYLSGIYNSQERQEITDSTYSSPGTRPSRTELRIDTAGIYLKLFETDSSGIGSFNLHEFRKIPYGMIKAVYPIYIKYSYFNDKAQLASLNIETTDRKLGHIDLVFHRADIVFKLLEKHMGDRWREVFYEKEPISMWEMNRLRSRA